MIEDSESGKVTYTVRELLAKMDTKLDSIDGKLDSKAEKVIVENLASRLVAVETQLQIIAAGRSNKRDFDFLWIPTIFNFIGVTVLALLSWLKH